MAVVVENIKLLKRQLLHDTRNITKQPFISQHYATVNRHEQKVYNETDYTMADYPGILDTMLTTLTASERIMFIVLVTVLFLLSITGNIGTLHVNFRRKIRPFFRACLISLAISDLINTVFLTIAYMSQFTAEYVQIWRLGTLMCSFVPFATTAAILASSMTLVGIALDRYFAVMKAVIGFWNPGVIFCIVCMSGIWTASIAIASPVFCIYYLFPVYILSETDTNIINTNAANMVTRSIDDDDANDDDDHNDNAIGGSNNDDAVTTITNTSGIWKSQSKYENITYVLVSEEELVKMCISHQKDVTLYYVIVFAIIFIPCIVAFVWLNSVIAQKLWRRRHTAATSKKDKSAKIPSTKSIVNSAQCFKKRCPIGEQHISVPIQNSNSTTLASSLAVTMGGGSIRMPPIATDTPSPPPQPPPINAASRPRTGTTARESRHIRMFTIIILMMAVFLFFRLPAWIFLIMRMYGSYTKPVHWILYFSFGVLNLTSCVLNPLFYTFLTEAIQCAIYVKLKIRTAFCDLSCCERKAQHAHTQPSTSDGGPQKLFTKPNANYGGCHQTEADGIATPSIVSKATKCFGVFYCGRCDDSMSSRLPMCTASGNRNSLNNNEVPQQVNECQLSCAEGQSTLCWSVLKPAPEVESEASANYEKDEGVECNSNVSGDEGSELPSQDVCGEGGNIFTIYPSTMTIAAFGTK